MTLLISVGTCASKQNIKAMSGARDEGGRIQAPWLLRFCMLRKYKISGKSTKISEKGQKY